MPDLPPGYALVPQPDQTSAAGVQLPPGYQLNPSSSPSQPPLDWGTRLKSLFGDPTAQSQVLAASTAAVRNSPAGGIAAGLSDPIYALRQLATHAAASAFPGWQGAQTAAQNADTAASQREQDYQQNWRQGNTDTDYGRYVGQALSTLPLASVLPAGATALGRGAYGLLSGGLSGAITSPVTDGSDYWSQLGTQAATGAAAGGIAAPAFGALAGAIGPNLRKGVQPMLDAGVTGLTPGQLVGGGISRMEHAFTKLPGLGDAILNARHATEEQFNRGAINQALAPIGEKLESEELGRNAIGEMQDKISAAYDKASKGLGIQASSPASLQLANSLLQISQDAKNLPTSRVDQFNNILQSQVINKLSPYGGMTPESFKEAKSTLGQLGTKYIHSSVADEQILGEALLGTQSALKNALRTSNPDAADALAAADRAFAMGLRVQDAGVRAGSVDEPGVFTPKNLATAARLQDPSIRDRQFARGDALMQNYAEAGQRVLGNTPTAGNAALHTGGGLLSLVGLAHVLQQFGIPEHVSYPAALGAYGGLTAGYSPTGLKVANTLVTSGQNVRTPIGNALRAAIPGAALNAPIAYQALNTPYGSLP